MELDWSKIHKGRNGFWLPKDPAVTAAWVKRQMERVRKAPRKDFDSTIDDLKSAVDADPIVQRLSDLMFSSVPPEFQDLVPVKNFYECLQLFNDFLSTAPCWSEIDHKSGLIGFPFNAVLDYPMATAAGQAFFSMPQINLALKNMLTAWAKYLITDDSAKVLHPKSPKNIPSEDSDTIGWLGRKGIEALTEKGNQNGMGDKTSHTFTDLYVIPDIDNKMTYGWTSWDDFFTRKFNSEIRRIASPGDDTVIVHACESAPFQYPISNVLASGQFWAKEQEYSLENMLDNHYVSTFEGGTVYQAFLSALSYHCWHSPVDGTVVDCYNIDGTYYSENKSQGFDPNNPEQKPDPVAPNNSQAYIASVAARALIFIEATNKDIGLMCFIGIGMAEVSSCEVTVEKGQEVKKGDPIGMFHFGGSTHCLVFRPGVELEWEIPDKGDKLWDNFSENMPNFPLSSKLATVK